MQKQGEKKEEKEGRKTREEEDEICGIKISRTECDSP